MRDGENIYETIIIINDELTPDANELVVNSLKKVFRKFSARGTHTEVWGSKKLAYPIKEHKRGYYIIINHCCSEGALKHLHKVLDNDPYNILKYTTVRHDETYWDEDDSYWGDEIEDEPTPKPDAMDVLLGLAKY